VLIAERAKKLQAANSDMRRTSVSNGLVTCSGSGLDSHILPAAAKYQVAVSTRLCG